MDDFQKDIVAIIRAAFTGKSAALSNKFDLARGISFAKKHGILTIFYEGALLCGIPSDTPLLSGLCSDLVKEVVVDLNQRTATQALTEALEAENIDYLPLKGMVLKTLYPKPEMRTMCDADILIRLEQYPRIKALLEERGYTFKYESNHELVWTNRFLILELHKSVMTTFNTDFYQYFGTGWSLVQKVSGTKSQYEFNREDFYIFIFAHFTKHYRISGIGIKHILDLWVYKEAYPKLDWAYISDKLKQLKLFEFHKNITDVLNAWFYNGKLNEKTALITDVIFSSGQYGTSKMTNINRAIRDSKNTGSIRKTKIKFFFSSVFPPLSNMQKDYQILKKLPVLLPFLWIIRWGRIVIFQRKDIKKYVKKMKSIDRKTVDEHQEALRYVGLDFNFGEKT